MMSETAVTLLGTVEALTPPGLVRRDFVKATDVGMYDLTVVG
jgi:hypothetical protein